MKKRFGFEVKVNGEWKRVGPTDGVPYEYVTREDAECMMSICYPDQIRQHRLGGEEVVRIWEDDAL